MLFRFFAGTAALSTRESPMPFRFRLQLHVANHIFLWIIVAEPSRSSGTLKFSRTCDPRT
jgi:hypothetical protein